jgi:K+-transporting ATPase ATPase A chain
MTANGFLQILIYLVVLLALAKPLGLYMARFYEGESAGLDRLLGPLERMIYRLCGVRPDSEMSWSLYAIAVVLFSPVGVLFLYAP